MNIDERKLSDITPYENNPRRNDDAVPLVANSIKEFGFKQPIVIDKDGVIVAGHTRYLAAKKLKLKTVPCVVADDLTEEQVKAYRLADNKVSEAAEWDFELLDNELSGILDIDMEDFGFLDFEDSINIIDKYSDFEKGSLSRDFIVPPYSVLDARGGDWQKRKQEWESRTGDLSKTRDGEFGRLSGKGSIVSTYNNGTSNFDPCLAEIMYKWFCKVGGKVLDPFAGEQTKGYVAGDLGYTYYGNDIRQDQIDVNTLATKQFAGVHYTCGNSKDIDKLINEREFDFCFTSPPYYDLEVYSKEDLSSLPTYEEFMQQLKTIYKKCCDMLKDGAFFAVKVGEIRDKKGIYRNFVGDTIKIMIELGMNYYNELILVTPYGTNGLRARNSMRNRKVVKSHQNILVFLKGEPALINSDDFEEIKYDDESADISE